MVGETVELMVEVVVVVVAVFKDEEREVKEVVGRFLVIGEA